MQKKHEPAIHFSAADFQAALLGWYDGARRELPWRAAQGERADPFKVWLSEIMLQQTTVKAVIPYFEAFLAKWPTPEALAAAPRDEVLAAWAGLGYYSRARNLHACAQSLARDGFPVDEAGLRALPGVGAYTAAAIAAIAFDHPAAVVDGNVERVIARLFALTEPLRSAKPVIRALATALTPQERPGDYAQAMMDLGATICTPRSPSCLVCEVRAFCTAATRGEAERFPVKGRKPERLIRRGDAFVILRQFESGAHILLRRRKDKGLLGGMMEVPCSDWVAGDESATPLPGGVWENGHAVRHTFTHFHLEMRVFAAYRNAACSAVDAFGGEWAALAELSAYALPTVMKKAVASGLDSLGVRLPQLSSKGSDSSRASTVSSVEPSARPSTRVGRK